VAEKTDYIKFHADCSLAIDFLQISLPDDEISTSLYPGEYKRDCKALTITIPYPSLRKLDVTDEFEVLLHWSANLSSSGNAGVISVIDLLF
jgi:hypothetical protein